MLEADLAPGYAVGTALSMAVLVWWLAIRLVRPPRSPQARMAAYLDGPRSSLGGSPLPGSTPVHTLAMRRAFGPMLASAWSTFLRLLLWHSATDLEMALRHAGEHVTPDVYRRSALRSSICGPLLGALVGLALGRTSYVLVLFLAGAFAGARRPGERLRAKAKRRNAELRADLPTVACVVAVKIDNNKSLMVALSEVVEEGAGPLVEDLERALNLARAGYGEARSFELIASECAEPAAQRLYSFLAVATSGGLDLAGALLQQANEARQQRREELERAAARRQVSMVLPNLIFMTPVLFAFLLAPLPSMLFGK